MCSDIIARRKRAMKLFDKIVGGIASRRAYREIASSPLLLAATLASNKTWNALPLKDYFDEESRNITSRAMLDAVYEIIHSQDQMAAVRAKLTSVVLGQASYLVLILPPMPEPDASGMRGHPGVTGELRAHLLEAAPTHDNIKGILHGATWPATFENVFNAVSMLYWREFWWCAVMNALRVELGDYNKVNGRDWYKPFLYTQCVMAEDSYRREIGMPSAFPGPYDPLSAVCYSTFRNGVLSGAKYPDLAWRENYRKLIEGGSLSLPTFA